MKKSRMSVCLSGFRVAVPTILCALLLSAEAQAQTSAPRKTANEMALRLMSLARSAPEVLQAESELFAKAADVRSASLQQYPKFEVQTSLGQTNTELPNSLGVADARITAGLRYTVFDFGKASARLLAAQGGLQVGEHRTRQAVEIVIFEALSSYLQILRFELLLSVAQNSEKALIEIEALETRKVALGGAGITDSQVAATRRALSANKLLQFQSSLEESKTMFASWFGFTPGNGELPITRVPPPWLDLGSDGVVDAAMANNIEIAQARSTIVQSQAIANAESAARYPAIDATMTKRYEFPGTVAASAQLGLQVVLSSDNFLEGRIKADKAAAQVATDRAKLGVVTRNATQRASSAWRRTVSGYQREQLLSEAAIGSGDVFKARKRLNTAGRETTMALLDAQVEENNIYIDWVNAMFDARQAEFNLAKELGKLIPPEGADSSWASAFYQSPDYRDVVRKQLSEGKEVSAAEPVSNLRKQVIRSLGAIGLEHTFRMDGFLNSDLEAQARLPPPHVKGQWPGLSPHVVMAELRPVLKLISTRLPSP
jgi:outer membrane protein TolC